MVSSFNATPGWERGHYRKSRFEPVWGALSRWLGIPAQEGVSVSSRAKRYAKCPASIRRKETQDVSVSTSGIAYCGPAPRLLRCEHAECVGGWPRGSTRVPHRCPTERRA